MLDYRAFDILDPKVRQIAQALLTTPAHEVAVLLACPAGGLGEDQARGAALGVATLTEDAAFEVVLVDAVALASGASEVTDFLDFLEQFFIDEGFVVAGIDVALVDDVPQVVRVTEHLVQLVGGHGMDMGVAGGRAGGQAEVGHGGFEAFDAVLASGVQFPGFMHKGGALGIEGDGGDLLAADVGFGVEVAEFGAADGAAVGGFVGHLGGDVEAVHGVHEAVHDIKHALHRGGGGAFAEVIFDGDQADAELLELSDVDGGVKMISEGARPVVGDDVLDAGMGVDVGEHLLERRSVLDVLGGDAALDERWMYQFAADGVDLGDAFILLGGDGQPVGVDVEGSVELPFRGHSEVDQRRC
ncbi:hypothetical protein BOX37_07800 [Nocardia mangyaensis]|uniref:Uncharacterized protein n=1 Tax=Nocardia mangyaensis TaxID=2213200 RepID=A0A1J0VPE9_9NOCA|nr:hypothetical protein [Nocardia mangyaensis]APE33889.1 hypothetical protein BOX37_07800 [Nocardia mangyaensis]